MNEKHCILKHVVALPESAFASPDGKFLGLTKDSLDKTHCFHSSCTEPMFPGWDVSTKTILIKLLLKLICLLSPFPLQ